MLNRRDATILEATSVQLASRGHVQGGRGLFSKCGFFLPSCVKKTVVSIETLLLANHATKETGYIAGKLMLGNISLWASSCISFSVTFHVLAGG